MSLLSSREYWESRYKLDPEPFDWYQRFSLNDQFKETVQQYLQPQDRTLIVGAGTSRLTEELWAMQHSRLAWNNIKADCHMVNIDFSSIAVALLNERYARMDIGAIQNIVMDARAMEFEDSSFNAIIDKATLDSILCGEGGAQSGARLLAEVARVLKPGGFFFLLSNAPPKQRLPMLEQPQFSWRCVANALPKPGSDRLVPNVDASFGSDEANSKNHYLYIMTKEIQKLPESVED
ncbi:hypothetical protein AB1Y20_009371 [Prymnesium parvum]|uniref:Methyltransferase type 11 domain-containing protein n=1 Tax=Prymnesium parvum TaxID=97485 RepID=A0AB34K1F0_PRYPA